MKVRGATLLVLLFALARVEAQNPPTVVTNLLIFAGGDSGLFRSGNWGGTWEKVTKGLEELGALHGVVAAGPGVYVAGDGGFFASDDFGQTFRRMYGESVMAFCVSRLPSTDPTLFIGTEKGLLKSPDLGRRVAPTLVQGTPVLRIEWPGPDLIVVTSRGVLVSKDGGKSFDGGTGLPGGLTRALAFSSFYAADPVIFASPEEEGVFRSTDGGGHWREVGLTGKKVYDMYWFGPVLYAATSSGLFKSEKAGEGWMPIGAGLSGAVPRALLFPLAPANGSEVFLGTSDGIFHSMDGGASWGRSGLDGEMVTALATFPAAHKNPGRHP